MLEGAFCPLGKNRLLAGLCMFYAFICTPYCEEETQGLMTSCKDLFYTKPNSRCLSHEDQFKNNLKELPRKALNWITVADQGKFPQ